jgi:hypothetical protein
VLVLAEDDADVTLEGATLVSPTLTEPGTEDVSMVVVVVLTSDVDKSVDVVVVEKGIVVVSGLVADVEASIDVVVVEKGMVVVSVLVADVEASVDVVVDVSTLVVVVPSAVDSGACTKEMTRRGRASARLLSRLPRARAVPKESSSTWRSIQPW